jgi:hypothetical protein
MLPGSTPSALPFLFMTATTAETMGASVGIVNGYTDTSAMAPWPGDVERTSSSSSALSSPGTCIMAWVQPCERPGDQRLRQFFRIGALRVGGLTNLAYSYGSPVEHPVKKPRNFRHSWPRHTPRRASSPLRALWCKPLGALGSRSLSIAVYGATDKFFRQPIGE